MYATRLPTYTTYAKDPRLPPPAHLVPVVVVVRQVLQHGRAVLHAQGAHADQVHAQVRQRRHHLVQPRPFRLPAQRRVHRHPVLGPAVTPLPAAGGRPGAAPAVAVAPQDLGLRLGGHALPPAGEAAVAPPRARRVVVHHATARAALLVARAVARVRGRRGGDSAAATPSAPRPPPPPGRQRARPPRPGHETGGARAAEG